MTLAADYNAAQAHTRAGRLEAAEDLYRRIVAHREHELSLHNLAVILEQSGRIDDAGGFYERAVAAAPDDPRMQAAWASHLRETRRFAEAEGAWRRTLALAPDYPEAAFILGAVLLAQGRFAEAWPLYDERPARRGMLRRGLKFPEWRGEPLAGKRLLIWREQGFGDQIMMARFLEQLEAAQVTYAGPPALRRLFESLPATFDPVGPQGYAPAMHDYWTLPFSLPRWLGAQADPLPTAPYLFGRPGLAGGRIGVVWRGQAANRNDAFRSLSEADARPLLALPGAISLEPADTGAQDFQATADIIAGLDLVITVDTAVAHLAGAMGRPVWVMLARYALDWSWPRQGASPWYPSARLFTQATAGAWGPVVAEVREAALALPAGG
jgi:hypothetical protein